MSKFMCSKSVCTWVKSGDKQWHVILIQVLTFLPKITSPNPGPWKWKGTPVPAPVEQKER